MIRGRWWLRGGLVVAFSGLTLVVGATPAAAHGLGGLKPTNYESVLRSVTPHVRGLDVRVVDLGTQVELTTRGDVEVVVLGYAGEPYLRVGPRGVFENTRSPATYLNRSSTISGAPPKQADATAPPVWKRVSTARTARWHDHRAHFMGTDDPPEVARRPDDRHVVDNFEIPMRVGGQAVAVRGQIVYVPPPSPWPWVLGAVVLTSLVVAVARTRFWPRVFAIVLGTLALTELLHVIGLWGASSASFGTKALESAYSIAGIVIAIVALGWMARRGVESAVPVVLIAAIFLFVAGGLADVATLGHSQVPSTYGPGFTRLLVTITLGLGAGLTIAAAWRLRPTAPVARPRVTS
jgi:hypothetical protein